MDERPLWMVYGANGYTGRLIAHGARQAGLEPILAGRNGQAIKSIAAALALPHRVFGVDNPAVLRESLAGTAIVTNCAGPFSATAQKMIDACLANRTHYTDITGEIAVLDDAHRRHDAAHAAGVVLAPGVGFDVIPTDCVAACLKEALPGATHLALGFEGAGSLSPGTARTSIEGLKLGGRARIDGRIVEVPLAYRVRMIDFGRGARVAVTFPWGDIATAYFSTGIPNIEVYIATSPKALLQLRRLNRIRRLLAIGPVQSLVKRIAGKINTGPSPERLATDTTLVWGEARDAAGTVRTARLTTSNGYRLTVDGVLLAVRTLLARAPGGGYYTPSQLMGPRCVEQLPGSSAITIT